MGVTLEPNPTVCRWVLATHGGQWPIQEQVAVWRLSWDAAGAPGSGPHTLL